MKPTKKRIARAVMPIGLPGRRTTNRRKLATAASTATALTAYVPQVARGLLAAGGV
jgi:hypothetical protein